MEPQRLQAILNAPVQRLVRNFAPERIVLFGSYAKGSDHPGSDIDLLVVAALEGDPAAHLRRARQLVADAFPPIDVTFCSPAEAAGATALPSPFLHSILGSGITLYQREPKPGQTLQSPGLPPEMEE